jgi:hypothetical protein
MPHRPFAAALGLLLTLAACSGGATDEPSPYEVCKAEGASCCADAECGEGRLCDFDYLCSVMGDHSVECSDWSGSRTCLDLCAEDGTCAAPALTCVLREQFQGGDHASTYRVCAAEVREDDRPVARVGREQRGRYSVVWLAGTPREMGRQQGTLLHDELAAGVNAIENDPLLKAMFAMTRTAGLLEIAEAMSLPEIVEECEGLVETAGDTGWSLEHCLILNFGDVVSEVLSFGKPTHLQIEPGCSQIIVSGSATADGRLYHARTLDWAVIQYMIDYPVVFVRQPAGGLAHVIVGFPANLSPYQGMNVKGLVLASNQVDPLDKTLFDVTGQSHVQVQARLLAQAASLAEARDAYLAMDHMTFETMVGSDPSAGEVFELNPTRAAVRDQVDGVVLATNHYLAPDSDPYDEAPSGGSARRLARLQQLVPKDGADTRYGTFTPEVLAGVLRDRVNPETGEASPAGVVDDGESLATNGALYQIIFDPAGLRFWVAAGALPVPEQPFVGFSLAELLGLEGYEAFPPNDLP